MDDSLALILGPGEHRGVVPGSLALALALHAAMAFAVAAGRPAARRLADQHRIEYEVEVDKPALSPQPEPPPALPEPEPERAPAPAPRAQARPAEDDPYKNAAPVPAQAAKVVTSEPKDDAPVNLPTVVSGEGSTLGGVRSAEGKGDQVGVDKRARLDGDPRGPGQEPARPPRPPPPPPAEDRSRPVGLVGGSSWSCPFPAEADAEQIDDAVVTVQVTVRADGGALSATVIGDPGHGFGRAARTCALAQRYEPALDRQGSPVAASAPVNVRFHR
jgi:protein TonB